MKLIRENPHSSWRKKENGKGKEEKKRDTLDILPSSKNNKGKKA